MILRALQKCDYVFTATKLFKFKMVKDTVQSLKGEDDKLKEKVEEV